MGSKDLESDWHLSVNNMRRKQQIHFFQSAASQTSNSTDMVREDKPCRPGLRTGCFGCQAFSKQVFLVS